MDKKTGAKSAWRIARRFDGSRDPRALLQALIQAHSK